MRKMTALLLAVMMVLGLAACGQKKEAPEEETAQIPNPMTEHETMAEAAEAAGFEMTVPETVEGYGDRIIQDISGEMIQVVFLDGDDRLTLRKAEGDEDISGDYNNYPGTRSVRVGERSVTMRGTDSEISVATWTDGDYAFSVTSDRPVSEEEMAALVEKIG